MKLRRLKILKFRNVQPGTELEFNDGYNVLLGQNGSGKTTLLRLITSVLRGDFVWLEKEAFALEAELEMAGGKLAIVIDHHGNEREEQQLDILPSELRSFVPTNDAWATTFDLQVTTTEGAVWQLRHGEDGSTFKRPGLAKESSLDLKRSPLKPFLFAVAVWIGSFLDRLAKADRRSTLRQLNPWIDGFAAMVNTCRVDESLELFSAITGRRTALGREEYGEVPERFRMIRNESGQVNVIAGIVVPAELRQSAVLQNANFDAPVDYLSVTHEQAPFLAKVMQMLGYVGAEIKLDLLGKEVTEQQQTIEYGNLRFFFHGRDGSIVNQDHLSYGQKRLLTFFYYLACNPHVVVADELVNGLHHAWIAECIRAMGDRQIFVTSQNPVLLDHLGFDSAETVRRTFITCQAKPEGVRDRITWANMSKKNADAFYRAYKVGAQHVGEILRTKGFW